MYRYSNYKGHEWSIFITSCKVYKSFSYRYANDSFMTLVIFIFVMLKRWLCQDPCNLKLLFGNQRPIMTQTSYQNEGHLRGDWICSICGHDFFYFYGYLWKLLWISIRNIFVDMHDFLMDINETIFWNKSLFRDNHNMIKVSFMQVHSHFTGRDH